MRPATRNPLPWRAIAAALLCLPGSPGAATPDIEEVVVTARLREEPLMHVPASVSVLPASLIAARQAQHLEELLNAVPNVNFNLGASRGRFVQIRGIGERSQFVDPVDPSVGLYIDGIDFSGLGSAGTLFDVEQVEVLRGPQGTAFGASAMAGLVNIRSAAPAREFAAALHASATEYQGRSLGLQASGPVTPSFGARFALEQYRSDGYMENDVLGREDTNAIDERTARLRLAWSAGEALELGLSALRADVDNGYDAFSLDNTRHTLSDQPGRDRQRSDALALSARWSGAAAFDVETTATWSDSELDYGYDEDWSWPGICAGQPCEGWEYASTDRYLRDVGARSLDLRLLSREHTALGWIAGLYTMRRNTTLERRFFDFAQYPPLPARFGSDYDTARDAAYAELSWSVTPALELGSGLRAERFDADYDDTLDVRARPGETLWGGQLSAEYALGEQAMAYLLVSRGFKAGGVNGEAIGKARAAALAPSIIAFLEQRTEFDTETLWNYELGYRRQFAAGWLRASVFRMEREDVQLKAWYNEGPQFVGYTDNAARGENRGAELEALWQPLAALDLALGIGLLDTCIDDFVANDPDQGLIDKSGRDQAQAPDWQFHAALEWRLRPRLFARLEWEGKDAYFFSDSDDQRSQTLRLLHVSAGWRGERLAATAWLRNALDEDYAVHGFYFGNDPRKFYVNEPYFQLGAPRTAGLTLDYRFGD